MLSISTDMIDKAKFFDKRPSILAPFFSSGDILSDDKITYVWSREPEYIKQYMKIIDDRFSTELKLKDIYKKIDLKDLNSHFYLFLKDNQVVGGTRLSINNKFSHYSLPAEKWGIFKYADIFPELDLENNACAEIGRYAVLPEYRNDSIHYILAFKEFKRMLTEHGVKYLFLCGNRPILRIYNREARKNFKLIDMREVDVSSWDDFKHLEYYVSAYENEDVK